MPQQLINYMAFRINSCCESCTTVSGDYHYILYSFNSVTVFYSVCVLLHIFICLKVKRKPAKISSHFHVILISYVDSGRNICVEFEIQATSSLQVYIRKVFSNQEEKLYNKSFNLFLFGIE